MLLALLKIHGTSQNDESLRTLLAKVEANTRLITSESLLDVHSPIPLCPMQLLTIKSCLPRRVPEREQIVGNSGDLCE